MAKLETPSVTIPMTSVILPATVVLSSVAAGRLIEYQADPERPDLLITVVPDVTTTYQLIATCNSRVAYLKITGAIGDTYSVVPFVYS